MTSRTLCLNLLVLISTAVPGQALRLMRTRLSPQVLFAGVLVAVAALALYLTPAAQHLSLPENPRWYAIAAAAGLVAPFAEYLLGALALRRFGRLSVHERSGRGALAVGAATLAAAAEEAIFRGVAMALLTQWFVAPAAVAITSVTYGFNHLYFGWLTVAQKTMTGVGYGVLFLLSGQSILIPITAHVFQNLVVLLILQRRAK